MSASTVRSLAILAGGAGTRMGEPKGRLVLNGRPILEYLLDRFAWEGPTLLVTAPGREHPPGCARFTAEACDPVADQGPLRGILTALEQAATDIVVVTTVDMPSVRPEQLRWLAEQVRPDRQGVLLRRGDRAEPFPSVYRRSAGPILAGRLAAGRLSVHGLLDDPNFESIEAPADWPAETWTNLNRPEDVAAFTHRTRIVRYRAGRTDETLDELAEEQPLEIRIHNRAVSITMRTPGHDHELAVGFLLSENLIRGKGDLAAIEPCPRAPAGDVLNVTPAPHVQVDFARLTRHVFASSSCGLCGKATLDSICSAAEPISSNVAITPSMLLTLPDRLREAQPTFSRTGGLHGAALFSKEGRPLVTREDVGRHNAVDKVLGHAILNDIPTEQAVLLVSGRASFEIVQKTIAARVPILAAVSAPSSLAVELAERAGVTLVAFLRDDRFNVYTHPERVVVSS